MQIKGIKCVEKNEQVKGEAIGFEVVLQAPPAADGTSTATVMLALTPEEARKFRVGTVYAMSFRTDKGEEPEMSAAIGQGGHGATGKVQIQPQTGVLSRGI